MCWTSILSRYWPLPAACSRIMCNHITTLLNRGSVSRVGKACPAKAGGAACASPARRRQCSAPSLAAVAARPRGRPRRRPGFGAMRRVSGRAARQAPHPRSCCCSPTRAPLQALSLSATVALNSPPCCRKIAAREEFVAEAEPKSEPPGKRVGLFVTCLVDLLRPSVGFAAVKLLEDAGCTVEVPLQSCC